MRIVWTIHSLERVAQRGVSKDRVRECLSDPDAQYVDAYGNSVFVKKVDGHVVVVVARAHGTDYYRIITVLESSKVDKYLRRER